jgi:general secretion pathway protein G
MMRQAKSYWEAGKGEQRTRRPGIRRAASPGGFTLLEILVVIAILGILASLIAVRIMDRPGEARITKAQLDIQTLENALKLYKLDNAAYPSTDQGLRALVEKPTIGRIPNSWREGGYLEKGVVPMDPWERDYLYLSPGVRNRDFDLWSYGGDGEEGGEGEDRDVYNWVEKER